MYHKCVKCGKIYEQASEEIIVGCNCGSKLFYFVKPQSANKKKNSEDVETFYELEDDVTGEITIFDIEAIQVKGSGKYELNIERLMNNDSLIYKYGDGKYSIDLDANFNNAINNSTNNATKNFRGRKKG